MLIFNCIYCQCIYGYNWKSGSGISGSIFQNNIKRKVDEMDTDNLLTRAMQNSEELVYQLISSEAFCLKDQDAETAYSILVARTDGEVVLDSVFAYDVSRREERGREVMRELWQTAAEPSEVIDAVSELL